MRLVTLLSLLILLISGCKKESKTEWDSELLAPIARTTLSIENLVKDSLARVNGDDYVTLVYNATIYELNLADQLIKIPDTSILQKITVDSLMLSQTYIIYKTSLGAIAANLIASPDGAQQFLGNYIMNNHGNTANIAPINGFSTAPFAFDGTSYFQTLELSQGNLEFWLVNHLPIPITNVNFEIRNASSNTLVLSDNIPYVPAYDSIYKLYDLAGKTVDGSLKFQITSFNSPGSGSPVPIDTNDYIRISGRIFNIRAKKAIARFPSQDLISSDQELTQNVGERKFTYVDCKSGQLEVNISSSIQEKLRMTYRLKGAYNRFGRGIEAINDIPASINGIPQTVSQTYDLSGYAINLTGSNGSKFNTYTQVIIARIDSTGILREITSEDSLFILYKLKNIKPNYIKGYAGRDTILFAGSSPFSFSELFSGNAPNALDFKTVDVALEVDNGLGVDGVIKINSLSSTNSNGNVVTLFDNSPNSIIGKPLSINRATDFPLTPAKQQFTINSTSSNIKDFLTNLPNKVDYDIEIKTNPAGNRNTYDDFAYLDSRLKVNLNLSIPLDVKADNLKLRDTFNFALGNSPKEIENIKDGILYLIAYNKFPMQAQISLLAYDSLGNVLDTLLNNVYIPAAPTDQNCRANTAKKTVIPINLPTDKIKNLFNVRKAVLTATFDTKTNNPTCDGNFYKIYLDYKLDAKITAQFNYRLKL
jgi:hypothetical protein